jgi:hypothetical protein
VRAVLDEGAIYFTARKRDKALRGIWALSVLRSVFEKLCIMAAHTKDKEITRIADNSVLEFVIRNLCKKLVGEGEKSLYLRFG